MGQAGDAVPGPGFGLGLAQGALRLAPYDPRWPAQYAAEASLIERALPGVPYDIHHIGSTSIPGLAAKPILDIAMQSAEQDRIAAGLVTLGYIDRGYRSGRLFVRLSAGDIRTHNLHLYPPGDPDCAAQLTFRDALRADPALADSYAALKASLVAELGNGGRALYADRKGDFVAAVVADHASA